jgi:hypothetical protein
MSKLASKTLTGLEGDDDKLSLDFDGNLDFSNLEGFEELDLKDDGNNITIDSGKEGTISKITGGSGDDNITLDFSNINNIDGGAGTDTVTLSGANQTINNSDFANVFNIEALNFSGDYNTIDLDAQTINAWLSGSGSTKFTISGSSDDILNISNNIAYNWTTTDNDYATNNTIKDIGGVADTYYIDTNHDDATDFTLTIAAV